MRQNEVAIIPLNDIVFFPGTSLYLYLDEQYLIDLALNSIEEDIFVGFALASSYQEILSSSYISRPIFTLGKPELIDKREDGTCEFIVKGVSRAYTGHITQEIPYIKCTFEPIEDFPMDKPFFTNGRVQFLREELQNWARHNIPNQHQREDFLQATSSLQSMVNHICMFLIQDLHVKQMLLQNRFLDEKIYLLSLLLSSSSNFEKVVGIEAIKRFEELEYEQLLPQ